MYDDSLAPLYRLAAKYDKPVAVHTGLTAMSSAILKYSHPLVLDEAAAKFPSVCKHMKKIAIALLLAALLALCGCSSDSVNEKEGAAANTAASSDSGVSVSTDAQSTSQDDSSTLPTVEDGGDDIEIEFGSVGEEQTATTEKSSGGSSETAADNNDKSGNGSEETSEGGEYTTASGSGISMPRITIPQS